MKKNILTIITLFVFSSVTLPQYLKVEKQNGETLEYTLSDIDSITFNIESLEKLSTLNQILSFDKLIIHNSGVINEIAISDIVNIAFNDTGTVIYFQTTGGLSQYNISEVDSITFSGISDSTVYIVYNESGVGVTNPLASLGVLIEVQGSDVVVNSTAGISDINYVLSGMTSDGMFKIYSDKKLNLHLNNVQITNNDGPAINIQSSKKITVDIVEGTNNILTDGVVYSTPPDSEDQDAAFFSEGQLIFTGNGILEINANGTDQHGIKSDDYIEINSGSIKINHSVKDGVNVNDGFYMFGGSLDITATGDGIDADENFIEIYDGSVTVLSSSQDVSALKADSLISISGGLIDITVQGNQSKGLNSNRNIEISGGNFQINTSGGVVLEPSGFGFNPSYCTAINADSLVRIDSCTVTISTSGGGSRGISCDGLVIIESGTMSIVSTGNGATYTNSTGQTDAYTGPCINSDGRIYISGGETSLSHSGRGGKGIYCDAQIIVGSVDLQPTLNVTTTGQSITISNGNYAEAKAISADSLIKIYNGNITISSADDGIKSKTYVDINGGTLNINNSKEGIEAPNIFVNGGEVRVNATDDGFNATYGNGGEFDDGSNLTFNNGYVYVSSTQGDAIDSNGDVNFNGGVIIVHGPQSSPEVGMDYNGTCKVTGGFVVISGTNSNMTQAPGNTSTQRSVLLRTSQSLNAGTLFHLEDTNGNTLLTFAPNRRYYSIVFSDSALTNGTSYRVYTGGSSTGTLKDGLYTGGTYSGGTLRTTFTLNNIVQTVTF
ncbi:MAG: carbohydrate-binding domain-containing protein [Ignavibacteriales bacterium]|nr:MAG: carbohydrate-binding domain-containing protein [Ignavibacteriales bacterium]